MIDLVQALAATAYLAIMTIHIVRGIDAGDPKEFAIAFGVLVLAAASISKPYQPRRKP